MHTGPSLGGLSAGGGHQTLCRASQPGQFKGAETRAAGGSYTMAREQGGGGHQHPGLGNLAQERCCSWVTDELN